jgi:hypothetical protein
MPVFQLSPNRGKLNDPAWLTSRHRGPCIVIAETAEAARRYANCAFILAVAPDGLPNKSFTLPWSQPDLVIIVELRDASIDTLAVIGSVMVEGRTVHGMDDAAAPPGPILRGNALRHGMAPLPGLSAEREGDSAPAESPEAATMPMEARLREGV